MNFIYKKTFQPRGSARRCSTKNFREPFLPLSVKNLLFQVLFAFSFACEMVEGVDVGNVASSVFRLAQCLYASVLILIIRPLDQSRISGQH